MGFRQDDKERKFQEALRLLHNGINKGVLTETEIYALKEENPNILNHRYDDGKTPLVLAVEYLAKLVAAEQGAQTIDTTNAKSIIALLLKYNADPALTYNARTPFQHMLILLKKERSKQTIDRFLINNKTLFDRLDVSKQKAVEAARIQDSSQGFILNLRQALGYQTDAGGLCHGYAHMAMQAFLVDPVKMTGLKEFRERLQWAKERGIENVIADLRSAESKRKSNQGLSKDEEKAESIRAFYDGIELYQQTHELSKEHDTLFGEKKPLSQEAELAAPLAMSQQLEDQGGLVTAYRGVGSFSHEGLIEYFESFATHAANSNVPLSLTLTAAHHSICINYDPSNKTVTLINANQSQRGSEPITTLIANTEYIDASYSSYENELAKKLAPLIERAFFIKEEMQPNDRLFMSTTLFARAKDRELALKVAGQWKDNLAPYRDFKTMDSNTVDIAGCKVINEIKRAGDIEAYQQLNLKSHSAKNASSSRSRNEGGDAPQPPEKASFFKRHRRSILFGIGGGLALVAGATLTVLSAGAALPLFAVIGVGVGSALISTGVGAPIYKAITTLINRRDDTKKRVKQRAESHGEVGAILKPEEAPLSKGSTNTTTGFALKEFGVTKPPARPAPEKPAPAAPPVAQTAPARPAPPAAPTPPDKTTPVMETRYRGPGRLL